MPSDTQAAIAAWRNLLGAAQVLGADEAQIAYGQDTGSAKRRLLGALLITETAQVADAVGIAHQHRVPVYPISTGHNWGYGTALPARDDCVIVDLSRLRDIFHFDAELGVVTVGPGVTQGMLADFLAAGQHEFLVPVTGAGPTCSLLSNALERGYGGNLDSVPASVKAAILAKVGQGELRMVGTYTKPGQPMMYEVAWKTKTGKNKAAIVNAQGGELVD